VDAFLQVMDVDPALADHTIERD